MEVEGDHSVVPASSISQGPSLDANESLASLSPPPFLHNSLDVSDTSTPLFSPPSHPSASRLADFDTPASPGPSSMHMSTSSESCSVPCYDIGLLLKSTPQSHVRCFSSSRKYSILTIILSLQVTLNFQVNLWMVARGVANTLT